MGVMHCSQAVRWCRLHTAGVAHFRIEDKTKQA